MARIYLFLIVIAMFFSSCVVFSDGAYAGKRVFLVPGNQQQAGMVYQCQIEDDKDLNCVNARITVEGE